MAFISRLQGQMCVSALLLTVCFMSLTADAISTTVTAALPIKPNATTHTTPSINSTTTPTTSPTSLTPSKAPSTTTETPTNAPVIQTTAARPAESGFDPASFVGGIILGVVITGILILGFKWWQSRNKSYHSL